ncbi:periostin, osteoblast specific factor b isoform X2 [Periophthalmus magnuspinnatus]|uniref:periostin, osteoblast specific factor b isoform X2 n=1 Tax=Periophthalmus magnuspinnatus TaxID=409849 RepID=UPI002436D6DD|nr:periostin, osteoblast specific factor b isoform X2 [Periophthalmus magnuspinnatus]
MKLLFLTVCALWVLCALDHVDSSAYDKIVAHSRIRARKEGPNMCALQQVMGTKKKYFSTCRNWYKGAICGKKATVVYECCPGYMKLDNMRGCPAVAPIDHVYGTLGLVKASSTQNYADISKLRPEIEGPGSFTFFAPSNDAWDLLNEDVRNNLVSNVNIELYNALHYHMANKRYLTKDLKNGMTITSMYQDLNLHINHYPNGVVTVNCARIIHGNQVSTNGVVHVIDRVIQATGNTIQSFVEVDDDLTTLSDILQNADLMDKLGEKGQFTLFAPTNAAFDKIGIETLERLQDNKDALQALVKYHLLNSVQCSEAIMSGTSYETMEGSNIDIGCDGDSLTVNGVKMVLKKDIVTSNGVIHLVDQVLMPDSAKQVLELVGASQSTFGDMVTELGLAAAMKAGTEYTLLAPSNVAFTDEVMSIDQSALRLILENHILKNKFTLGQLYNGQRLETLGGLLLRVFIYRSAVCIENACLIRGSREGSNGALHSMKTFLKPAESSMYEILTEHGGFKIFLSLMEAAGLTDLLKQEGDFTLFAPSDKAFAGLSSSDLALLKKDINALRTILLYHFNNGVFIGGGLEMGVTNLLKSLQGSNLRVIAANNSISVNTVPVSETDIMATNGALHYIDKVLYPADMPVGNQELISLLRRFITYMQFKFISGFRYQEIPLTFLKRIITRVETVPDTTKVTRVINRPQPSLTKVTRVIEGDPSITKVTRVIEGEPSLTKVTRVIEGEPSLTKVTRVIEGEPSLTKVTRVIGGEPSLTKVTRVIEGEPSLTKVTRVIEGEPTFTKVTRVVSGPQYSYSSGTTNVELENLSAIDGTVTADTLTKIVQAGRTRVRN